MVYAFIIPLGSGTNSQAETLAAAHGIQWGLQHGFKRIILEIDSELLTKWLSHRIKPPWSLQQHISPLINTISQLEFFQCRHTYREANSTADFLSKRSHKTDIVHQYYTYQQLPVEAKGSYLLEKMGMSNFRRNRLKRIKQPP